MNYLEHVLEALKSDLLKGVLRAFRAEAIPMPYPRRDVRMIATAETQNSL